MLKLLFTLLFTASFSAWANPVCDNKGLLESVIYANFLGTSHTLQHGFVSYYQAVSNQVDAALDSSCEKKLNLQGITREMQSACVKTCDQEAYNYFNGALDRTKKNQKLLFNECSTLCNVTTRSIHMMGLVHEKNDNTGREPLSVKAVGKNKKSSDSAIPKK